MGKAGALLRAQKKQQRTYTFTAAQLLQHDEHVIRSHREQITANAMEKVKKAYDEAVAKDLMVVNEEWDKRMQEFGTNDMAENFYNLLQYTLCISARVLIEKFNWKPIPKDGRYDRRNKMVQFSDAIIDLVNQISSDDLMDIRRFNEETYDLYGVKFMRSDDE